MFRSLSRLAHPRTPLSRPVAVVIAATLALGGWAVPAAADPPDPVEPTTDTYSWGRNAQGQLGDETTTDRTSPGPVDGLAGVAVTQFAGGDSHTLALTADGQIYAWGRNNQGQLGNGETNTTPTLTPSLVDMPPGVTVVQVAAFGLHSAALTSDGRIFTWGHNQYGQLGDGTTTNRSTPVEVNLPDGVVVTDFSVGYSHGIAVGADGRLFTWGRNEAGQLGNGTTTNRSTPVEVDLPDGVTVTEVSGGFNHSLALTADGQVLAWGENGDGQLGDGSNTDRLTPVEVALPDGVTVDQISGGTSFSLARTSDGGVLAWGSNNIGQLGDGTITSRSTPVEIALPEGTTVRQVSAGNSHSHAVTTDGRVLSWGNNSYGQVGNGTTGLRQQTPVEADIPPDVNVTQVVTGYNFSFALAEPRVSSTSLEADPTETTEGETVTLTATVSCTATTATGTVSFMEGDTEIGTAEVNENGVATLETSDLSVGEHEITARYGGDLACPASTSNVVTVTVDPSPATDTSLSAEPTEATVGDEVELTADVTCRAATPTGTVTFLDGDTEIGTAELDEDGVATLTTSDLGVGEHSITARYEGDDDCRPSTSDPVTVTIEPEASSPTPTPTSTSPEPTATSTSEPTEPGPPAPEPTPPHGQLPVTGSSAGLLLAASAGLIALGTALVAWRLRRRVHGTD